MNIMMILILSQILPGFQTCVLTPRTSFGAYFVVGEKFGFAGSFRARLGQEFDVGIKPAFLFESNRDTKVGIGVDGDFKFLIFRKTAEYPFNIALIPHSTIYFEENLFHLCFLTDCLFDFPISLENKLYMVPYVGGGLGISFESKKRQGETETKIYPSVEMKMGFLFKFTRKTGLLVEVIVSSFNTALGMGVNFEI